jgi:hypothetical protein
LSFSALKSEHHATVKFGQVDRCGDKGERAVGASEVGQGGIEDLLSETSRSEEILKIG